MIKTITRYIDENGLEFTFKPIENSLKIKEVEKELCPICKTELKHITIKKEDVFGCFKCKKEIERKKALKEICYEARYLIYDEGISNPMEDYEGMGYFFHWKDYGKEQLEKYCEALGYDIDSRKKIREDNPDAVRIDKYEHSRISYSVSGEGTQCKWDTSSAWAVWLPNDCLLEDLKRFKTKTARRKRCIELARQACKIFNQWANGEVYCLVKETYNANKEKIDYDTLGGFFDDYEDALKALETEI